MPVALKQGPTYAIFKIDNNMFGVFPDSRFSGTWTTAGPGKPPVEAPAAVPLPTGGALLLSALAGFAFLRRRKTT